MSLNAIQFYYKSTCSTCRNAKKYLQDKKIDFIERDYTKNPFNEKELKDLIGDRDITIFLNTRNELVQKLQWKKNPPTKTQFIQQALKEPNVIKRPILQYGKELITGFDKEKVDIICKQ